jgi:hypothetical protein
MLGRRAKLELHNDPEQLAREYVVRERDRARKQADRVRLFFRLSGMLMLSISVTIPFLAALQIGKEDYVIGILGVVMAFVTAARNFFHWDRAWAIRRLTEVKLTKQLGLWETDLARIHAGGDDAAAREKALERTKRLISEASEVIEHGYQDYFAQLSWPDPGEGRQGAPQTPGAPASP